MSFMTGDKVTIDIERAEEILEKLKRLPHSISLVYNIIDPLSVAINAAKSDGWHAYINHEMQYLTSDRQCVSGICGSEWYAMSDSEPCMPASVLKLEEPCPEQFQPGKLVLETEFHSDNVRTYNVPMPVVRYVDGVVIADLYGSFTHVFKPVPAPVGMTPNADIDNLREGDLVHVVKPIAVWDEEAQAPRMTDEFVGTCGIVENCCYYDKTVILSSCSQHFPIESVAVMTEDEAETLASTLACSICGNTVRDSSMLTPLYHQTWVPRRGFGVGYIGCVCENCIDEGEAFTCQECNETFSRFDVERDSRGVTVCSNCYDRYGYATCSDCGDIVADASYDNDGNPYCDACWQHHRHEQLVMNYSTKPDPIFHWTNEDGSTDWSTSYTDDRDMYDHGYSDGYFGVELEISGDNQCDCSEELHDIDSDENLFYMKADCSIGDEGIEIVTHPCTLDYHMKHFPWQKIVRAARNWDYTSHDSGCCGLHVHVNREFFGTSNVDRDLNIAKVILLFDKFWSQLVNFSRRTNDQLNRWCRKPSADINESDDQNEVLEKYFTVERSHNRYYAVNLENRNTVEFRLFRGTLNLNTLKATLQFLHHLIVFAKEHSLVDVQRAEWKDILAVMVEPEIKQYLNERHLLLVDPVEVADVDFDDEASDRLAA